MSKCARTCGCGYTADHDFGVNMDGSCTCNDCRGLAYPKDGTSPHADFCRQQKEKKAAEEAARLAAEEKEKEKAKPGVFPSKRCGCGDEFGHPRKPPAPHEKGPLVKIGATHDASGYPLPGKCVCGYELSQFDVSPENGKCRCFICNPNWASAHSSHCLMKLEERLATMQKTIDAQSDIITVKDDRIAEFEKIREVQLRALGCTPGEAIDRLKEEKLVLQKKMEEIIDDQKKYNAWAEEQKNARIAELEKQLEEKNQRVSELERNPFDSLLDRTMKSLAKPENMEFFLKKLTEGAPASSQPPFFPRSELPGAFRAEELDPALLKKEIAEELKAMRPLIRESTGRIDPVLIEDKVTAIKELYKCNDRLQGELAEARITIAGKDKKINEQAHQLQEKDAQIRTMRAQMEGLEHDKAVLENGNGKLMERVDGLGARLEKAKAQNNELESIIAAYAKDDSLKTGAINELTEKMVHFKKYRYVVSQMIVKRLIDTIKFPNGSVWTEVPKEHRQTADLILGTFPELRSYTMRMAARAMTANVLYQDHLNEIARSNLAIFIDKYLNNGGEHSPASGSTPESG